MYVWALDRIPSDERVAWREGLNDRLPGEPLAVADENFDDSYHQIKQAQ